MALFPSDEATMHAPAEPHPAPAERDGIDRITGRDIALAGFAATAVSYGPARMGFGLHLPQLAEEFEISSTLAGAISAGIFASFLLAALAGSWIVATTGPRAAVLLGCLAATLGLGVASAAQTTAVLGGALVTAGASAGLCWSPFNDVAARTLSETDRGTPLSLVSTGTTVGVALAGVAELVVVLADVSWRGAVVAYAAAGLIAGILAFLLLPPLPGRPGESGVTVRAVRRLGGLIAWPVGTAASFGFTAAVYLTFAADRLAAAGGLRGVPDDGAAGVLFVAYGLAGLAGMATATGEARIGLQAMLALVFGASAGSLALLAVAPTAWPAVVASAALQGMAVMVGSALLSFWTARLFPASASTAFTVVILGLALGGVAGPALAGLLLGPAGAPAVFGFAAGLSALTGMGLALADPPVREVIRP